MTTRRRLVLCAHGLEGNPRLLPDVMPGDQFSLPPLDPIAGGEIFAGVAPDSKFCTDLWKARPMEYLVTMTTNVPDGTPDQSVADVRAREAAHSSELAMQGHLLRLWRPPLRPGEWRSLGLFAAADDAQLEDVLASMPLRVWRTDEVTPLAPHPNDPGLPAKEGATEFLTTFTIAIPEGTPGQIVADTEAREAQRARELAGQGHLLRLWRLPGGSRALGLWRAGDPAEMQAILTSLPLNAWMTVQMTPLTPHPSDPGLAAS